MLEYANNIDVIGINKSRKEFYSLQTEYRSEAYGLRSERGKDNISTVIKQKVIDILDLALT